MHTFVRRALRTALVTGGLVVVGAGAAHAAEGDLLGDLGLDVSVEAPLSQVTEVLPDVAVDVPVHVPVTVSDVAVGALGDAAVAPRRHRHLRLRPPRSPLRRLPRTWTSTCR